MIIRENLIYISKRLKKYYFISFNIQDYELIRKMYSQ